jgi:23S rRNA (cytosine1962-C5)-methyltransferase
VVADVFEYLREARARDARWDLVVSDPPSFAKNKRKVDAALEAYAKLNALGLSVTASKGFYAAASCTSQVGPEAFRQSLATAAARAKRRLQIVHEAGQPLDHPVLVQHLEGRYLKFVFGRVLEPG